MKSIRLHQVQDRLRDLIRQDGSQRCVADRLGVSQQYLSDILAGQRRPGRKVLRALNLVRVETYEETR